MLKTNHVRSVRLQGSGRQTTVISKHMACKHNCAKSFKQLEFRLCACFDFLPFTISTREIRQRFEQQVFPYHVDKHCCLPPSLALSLSLSVSLSKAFCRAAVPLLHMRPVRCGDRSAQIGRYLAIISTCWVLFTLPRWTMFRTKHDLQGGCLLPPGHLLPLPAIETERVARSESLCNLLVQRSCLDFELPYFAPPEAMPPEMKALTCTGSELSSFLKFAGICIDMSLRPCQSMGLSEFFTWLRRLRCLHLRRAWQQYEEAP